VLRDWRSENQAYRAPGPNLLLASTNIRVIQVLLGHVNINTTGIYTQVSSKTMRAVASPLDHVVAVMEGRAPPG